MQNNHKNYQPTGEYILNNFHTTPPFSGWSAHSEVQNTLKTTELPKQTLVFLPSHCNVIPCASPSSSLRNAQSTPSRQGQHCNSSQDTPTFPQAWNTNTAAKSTWLPGNFVGTTRHMGLQSDITESINLPCSKVWRDVNLKAFQVHDQPELPSYCTLKTKIK